MRERLAIVALALVLPLAAPATPPASVAPWPAWRSLRLKARTALFLTGRVDMELSRGKNAALFQTATTARFMGAIIARSKTRTEIDRKTGHPRRYTSVTPKRGRRYIFGKRGYRVEKLVPRGDADAPLDQWELKSKASFDYPVAASGKGFEPVFDYYGMLLYLAATDLENVGDEVTMMVATSKGPKPYRVRIDEVRTNNRRYRDLATGKRRTIAARELRLMVAPGDAEDGGEGFMGMKGVTEIWVEADSKTLLSISGKVPGIPGRIVLELAALAPVTNP